MGMILKQLKFRYFSIIFDPGEIIPVTGYTVMTLKFNLMERP